MPLNLPRPITYTITSGTTTPQTIPDILRFLEAIVKAQIPLFQIREKSLPARVLYELTERAVEITRGSNTRLLVNDRADIARAAGADGVHLTARSLPADVVRNICGPEFVIGVSTHSLAEARAAQAAGADFVVFGPIFDTESKRAFGEPQGLEKLREVTRALGDFPVIAIGGVTRVNFASCIAAGASGIAGISMFERLRQ
ncbi:MAG TPA: thiamine phosphate synthase [Pyrinomonadaceae bacterium]|jgi:thiamine-phosphate pyrophosphorylase|nr:thiamine phosphate synthase [Pyrinomonadaceae bacterium]